MNHKLTWQARERLKAFGWKYFWHNQPISFCEAYIIAPVDHWDIIWLAWDAHLRVAVKQCKGPVSQLAQAGDVLPVYNLTTCFDGQRTCIINSW